MVEPRDETGSAANPDTPPPPPALSAFRTLFWVSVIVLGCSAVAVLVVRLLEPYWKSDTSSGSLDLLVSVEPGKSQGTQDVLWNVDGTVIERDSMRPVTAFVTVELRDESTGNRKSQQKSSDEKGVFSFSMPPPSGSSSDGRPADDSPSATDKQDEEGEGALSFVVTAVRTNLEQSANGGGKKQEKAERIVKKISVGQGPALEDFGEACPPFIFAVVLFLLNVMLVMVPGWKQYHSVKLYSALLIALLFSGALVVAFSWALVKIAKQPEEQPLSFGFAHLFFGGFGEKTAGDGAADPGWMVSLTQPPSEKRRDRSSDAKPRGGERSQVPDAGRQPALAHAVGAAAGDTADGAAPVHDRLRGRALFKAWRDRRAQLRRNGIWSEQGFGAPLWVLLLAVVGSSLYTVKLIVDYLKRGNPDNEQETRGTLKDIIQHQLFTLVAPLSAIFVYQAMVATNMNHGVLPVALAALASGLALTALLTKAMQSLPKWTQKPSESPNRDPSHLTPPPAAR